MFCREERKFIDKLISNGEENIYIDFKKEFSDIFGREEINVKNKAEFLKDCIGFLNANIMGDNYIIYGVTDDGQVVGIEEDNICDESYIQDIVRQYINPIPNIDIDLNYIYNNKRLIVIKFKKENRIKLYTFNKEIQFKKGKKNTVYKAGTAFERVGSSISEIVACDAIDFKEKRQNSICYYLDNHYDVNLEKLRETLELINLFDKCVDVKKLIELLKKDIYYSKKFYELFYKYIFNPDENENLIELDDIDGGYNSIFNGLFYIITKLRKIENLKLNLEVINTKVVIENRENEFDITVLEDINKTKEKINYLLNSYYSIQYKTYGIYFFNIIDVEFSKSINNLLSGGKMAFSVSDDIMKLFLEPLYSEDKPLYIAYREISQNSFDACKKTTIYKDNTNKVSVEFYLQDNSLSKVKILDTGEGMDIYDIKNYYLKVGKSTKNKDKTLGLIGQFGIGALANFLIADKCIIKTKKLGQINTITLEIKKENFQVISLSVEEDETYNDYPSFTEITLEIKDSIKQRYSTKQKIIKELKIDNMILQDDLNLTFSFISGKEEKKETIKIPTLNNYKDKLFLPKIKINKTADIYLYNLFEEDTLMEEEYNKKHIDILSNNKNKILYNNQIGNVKYIFSDFLKNFLKEKEMPFLLVDGYLTKEDGYKVELSRNEYTIDEKITDKIVNSIYKIVVPKIKKKFKEINEELSNENINISEAFSEIEEFSKLNYVKLPPIVFKNKRIEMLSEYIKNVIVINSNSNELMDLFNVLSIKNYPFIKEKIISERSEIANLVELSSEIHGMSFQLLNRFLIKADSSSNGFRKKTLVKILNQLDFAQFEHEQKAREVWDIANEITTGIKSKIDSRNINGIVYFTEIGKEILLKAKEKNSSFSYSNMIIRTKNIHISMDEEFKKLFNDEY